jgi:hypothetical protein
MIHVPQKYRHQDCEPVTTDYGKFLHKYNQGKKAKTSKIQRIIDDKGTTYFSHMSKFDLIHEYLLDEKYDLLDFISLKNASLKGFMFETLWDICFKCNVIEDYDSSIVHHYTGKIEELRNKTNSAHFKAVDNMLQYMKENKVQSGSSAGISDITMKYKDAKEKKNIPCREVRAEKLNTYVFVSCKYYLNEKAITKYDIAAIIQAVKGVDINYEIVLIVNNKAQFEKNFMASTKTGTQDVIFKIYDRYDLQIAFTKLRILFKHLRRIHPNRSNDWIFSKFFSSESRWKPLLPLGFQNYLIQELSSSVKNCSWYIFDKKQLVLTALCFIQHIATINAHAHALFLTNNASLKQLMSKYATKYHGMDENVHITVSDGNDEQYQDDVNNKVEYDVAFIDIDTMGKRFINAFTKSTDGKVIRVSSTVEDGDSCICWKISDALTFKRLDTQAFFQRLPMDKVENALYNVFGNKYFDEFHDVMDLSKDTWRALTSDQASYPDVNIFGNDIVSKSPSFEHYVSLFKKPITSADLLDPVFRSLLCDVIFGSPVIHLEDFVFKNRWDNAHGFHTTLIVVNSIPMARAVKEALTSRPFIKARYEVSDSPDMCTQQEVSAKAINKNLIVITKAKDVDFGCVSNLVLLNDALQPNDIQRYLTLAFEPKRFQKINVTVFNPDHKAHINKLISS